MYRSLLLQQPQQVQVLYTADKIVGITVPLSVQRNVETCAPYPVQQEISAAQFSCGSMVHPSSEPLSKEDLSPSMTSQQVPSHSEQSSPSNLSQQQASTLLRRDIPDGNVPIASLQGMLIISSETVPQWICELFEGWHNNSEIQTLQITGLNHQIFDLESSLKSWEEWYNGSQVDPMPAQEQVHITQRLQNAENWFGRWVI